MSQQYPGPGQHPTQPTNPYGQPYQPAAPRPLHKMKRVWAGGLGLLLIGTGCGAMGGDNGATTSGAAKPAPTVTVTATVTAPPAAPAKQPAPKTPAVSKTPAAPAPAPAVETAQLPDFVGKNHQDAQDTAQAAGFFNLREKDATGMERLLVLDRNWKVCRQEPAPGRHGVEKTITLYSVKESESC